MMLCYGVKTHVFNQCTIGLEIFPPSWEPTNSSKSNSWLRRLFGDGHVPRAFCNTPLRGTLEMRDTSLGPIARIERLIRLCYEALWVRNVREDFYEPDEKKRIRVATDRGVRKTPLFWPGKHAQDAWRYGNATNPRVIANAEAPQHAYFRSCRVSIGPW